MPKGVKPSSVTVSKDTAGRYFVSILVEEDIKPLPVINKQIGLDLGLKSMVITSDGQTSGNPKFWNIDEKKLARAQRRLAKKKKGSKNRNKARLKVARIHARISDRRRDYQHKLSTKLIRENQQETQVVILAIPSHSMGREDVKPIICRSRAIVHSTSEGIELLLMIAPRC